ncbi:MAG: hypothetical protein WCX46_00490 [Candidatus Paceibacterota bacterium]
MENIKNTLKGEHLKGGNKVIMGCIDDKNNPNKENQYFLDEFKKNAEFLDFNYGEKEMKDKNIKTSGKETYLISPINEKNKYSINYLDCTGVIFVGKDKITGKNISCLTHQNPEKFLEDGDIQNEFIENLKKTTEEFKNSCEEGSIDIVIVGGNEDDVSRHTDNAINDHRDDFTPGRDSTDFLNIKPETKYINSIKLLNYQISKIIGFSPVIMTPMNRNFSTPNHSLGVFFDTKNRRVYLSRPYQNKSIKNEPFVASDIESQIKKI